MKRKLFISLAISAVFLLLALRGIKWNILTDVLANTDPIPLAASVAFTMLGHYARAYRWKFMFLQIKRIPTNELFAVTSMGLAANNLLPARLGEFVRAHLIGRAQGISRTAALATILYERIVDVFCLLILLLWVLAGARGHSWLLRGGILILAANITLLVLSLAVAKHRSACARTLAKWTAKLPAALHEAIDANFDSFSRGLAAASQSGHLLPIAASSLLVWGFSLIGVWYSLLAVGMGVPFHASATLLVIVSLGTMIPAAPAYIGTMQYACIVSLALYGVGNSEALAFSLLFHAVNFVPVTITGLAYAWSRHVGIGDLAQRSAE